MRKALVLALLLTSIAGGTSCGESSDDDGGGSTEAPAPETAPVPETEAAPAPPPSEAIAAPPTTAREVDAAAPADSVADAGNPVHACACGHWNATIAACEVGPGEAKPGTACCRPILCPQDRPWSPATCWCEARDGGADR